MEPELRDAGVPWKTYALLRQALEVPGLRMTPIAKSRLLPGLDFALLTRFVKRTDQPAAIKEYRGLLRGVR